MRVTKAKTITGWVLTALVGAFLIGGSGVPKFLDFPGKGEMMEHLGIPLGILPALACLEIGLTLLLLFPPTAFLGAILMTGYLGGAVFAHVRVGDGPFPCLFPVILGVLLWTGLALRKPILLALVLGAAPASSDPGAVS